MLAFFTSTQLRKVLKLGMSVWCSQTLVSFHSYVRLCYPGPVKLGDVWWLALDYAIWAGLSASLMRIHEELACNLPCPLSCCSNHKISCRNQFSISPYPWVTKVSRFLCLSCSEMLCLLYHEGFWSSNGS